MRVCMLAYSFYDADNRIRRYAETLAQRGDEVDVIALRGEGQKTRSIIEGVRIFRIQKRVLNEKEKVTYAFRLLKFFIKSMIFMTIKHMEISYDLIHVHNIPDFLVFGAWVPKLTGSRIILDIHDVLPEFYSSKFNTTENSILFKVMLLIEKISASFCDHVIVSNHLWYKKLISRTVKEAKCSVILNYPDPKIFSKCDKNKRCEKFVIIYPGSINKHQGVDIAIKAFAMIKDSVPDAEFQIYGAGGERDPLAVIIKDIIKELKLEDRVFLRSFVALDQIAKIMANADLGIVPKRNSCFGGEAFSTKILEFMLIGIPVIVSRTRIDKYYFNDSVVRFFDPENEDDLASSMLELIRNDKLRETLSQRGMKFIEDFSWEKRKHEYLDLVDRLVSKKLYV